MIGHRVIAVVRQMSANPPPPLPVTTQVAAPNHQFVQDSGVGGMIKDTNGSIWCGNTLLLSIASDIHLLVTLFQDAQSSNPALQKPLYVHSI